jgi:nucleotide-binding universal stress UspA family protein
MMSAQIDAHLRGITASLFMPVFFGLSGLSANLTVLADPTLAVLTLALVVAATLGKATGAFAGGRLGGLSQSESVALATGMNARGSTEVVVATIGLSIGAITQNLFTMILTMAVLTTLAMPPTLRWALARLPLREEEKKRLQRETFDALSFLSEMERILVVVDDSANGKLAARLAGLIAGVRGMTVTRLILADPAAPAESAPANGDGLSEIIRSGARAAQSKADEEGLVDLIERRQELPPGEAIAAEARRNYGLMIVGVHPATGPDGDFSEQVSLMAKGFTGPLMIVAARGPHQSAPSDAPLKLLVPATGSEVSRGGIEMGLVIGKAAGSPITVLTVSPPEMPDLPVRQDARQRDAIETGREAKSLAEAANHPLRVMQRTAQSPLQAILREAHRGGFGLILLGASRRPGETLSLGKLSSQLLQTSERSLALLCPQATARAITAVSAEPTAAQPTG